MNPQRAEDLARHLVAATTGWTPDAILELTDEITRWGDVECAEAAIDYVRTSWAERSRPPLGWIIRAYNVEMDAKRRDAELAAPPAVYEPGPPPKQGREIAFQAYRTGIGLADNDESRARFGMSLEARMKIIESAAPDDHTNRALVAVGSGAMYAKVLRVFGGDHVLATRALRTLEKRGAILHGNDGWITVRYPRAEASVVSEVGPDVPRQPGQGGPGLDQ